MTNPLTALAAQPVPAYCTSGHGILTPAQWQACWNAGWNLPASTATSDMTAASRYLTPVVLIFIVVMVLLALSRRRKTATG